MNPTFSARLAPAFPINNGMLLNAAPHALSMQQPPPIPMQTQSMLAMSNPPAMPPITTASLPPHTTPTSVAALPPAAASVPASSNPYTLSQPRLPIQPMQPPLQPASTAQRSPINIS